MDSGSEQMAAMDIAVIGGEGRVDMGERGAILVAGKISLKADQFAGRGPVPDQED